MTEYEEVAMARSRASMVALLGAACGGDDDAPNRHRVAERKSRRSSMPAPRWRKIQDKGTITIGVKYDVPLFGFKNPQSGEVEGFDVDLGKRIAEELGVEAEVHRGDLGQPHPVPPGGHGRPVFSTMTITTDRDAEIDFSHPYFIAHGRIAVPGDSDVDAARRPRRQDGLHGSRFDLRDDDHPEAGARRQDQGRRHLLRVLRARSRTERSTRRSPTTSSLPASGSRTTSIELVGEDLTTDPYGVGIPDGDTEIAGVR